MTQEDKDLLLKDLCARLPYGVKGSVKNHTGTFVVKNVFNKGEYIDGHFKEFNRSRGYHVEEFKPYLRPMSSMTEEEHNEWFNYYHEIEVKEAKSTGDYLKAAILGESASIDWLNKNMFDFRGLIDKDLALSTNEYNPYKN